MKKYRIQLDTETDDEYYMNLVVENSHVDTNTPLVNGKHCFVFDGTLNGKGYGVINGKFTHRRMYEIYNQCKIKDKNVVMHACDITNCTEKEHLSEGTQKENQQDCIRKGRKKHTYHGKSEGAMNGNAKLNELDVLTIHLMLDRKMKHKDIAKQFDVPANTIGKIKNGQQWKHIPYVPNYTQE